MRGDCVGRLIAAARKRCTVYLPRPTHTMQFVRSLAAGGIFAGLCFLDGDTRSLNSRIATAKLAEVDESCDYLRSQWHPTRPVAA